MVAFYDIFSQIGKKNEANVTSSTNIINELVYRGTAQSLVLLILAIFICISICIIYNKKR